MNRLRSSLPLAAALVLGMMVTVVGAADPDVPRQPGTARDLSATSVTGELLKIEGETYLIRDTFGKEVRLRVGPETKIVGSPKIGDKIEAKVSEGGQATSIQLAPRDGTKGSRSGPAGSESDKR